MPCRVCGRKIELRMGVCWDCIDFESLIIDGVDLSDNPVAKKIEGSDALNILHNILNTYKGE